MLTPVIYLKDNSTSHNVHFFGILPLLNSPFLISFVRILQDITLSNRELRCRRRASLGQWESSPALRDPSSGWREGTASKGRSNGPITGQQWLQRTGMWPSTLQKKPVLPTRQRHRLLYSFQHWAGGSLQACPRSRVSMCTALPRTAWIGIFFPA